MSNYASSKTVNLFAQWTDMINDIYISMAFAACINTSALSMETSSVGFNTVYTVVMVVVLSAWPIFVTVKFAFALRSMPGKAAAPKSSSANDDSVIEIKEGGEIEEENKDGTIHRKGKKGKKKKKRREQINQQEFLAALPSQTAVIEENESKVMTKEEEAEEAKRQLKEMY